MGCQFLEPKPFYGNQTEDPREWIERTESWLSYNNYANWPKLEEVTDEEEKKSIRTSMAIAKRRVPYILELLLMESSKTWLSGLTMEEKETFEIFKERFRARYLEDRATKHSFILNLWEEKQKQDESVDAYYDKHIKLVKLAGLAATADANTNQAFVHGLLPHIKMQVLMQGKKDLKELLEAARVAEAAFRATRETPVAVTTSEEMTMREMSDEQKATSDNHTIKVLTELLESVVGAAVGKIASTTVTAPPNIHESTAVQVIEAQRDPNQEGQHGNAQNWIGQSRNTPQQQRRRHPQQQQSQAQQQQGWQPQQQHFQPQQQYSWQPNQQQSQPYQQQQQNGQSRLQLQSCQRQQSWSPRQRCHAQQSQQNERTRERPQQYGQPRQQPIEDSCHYCGRYHPLGRKNCGMVNKTCYTCGKKGHSYRMCRSTIGQQPTRRSWQPRTSRDWQPPQQLQQDRPTPHRGYHTDTGQLGLGKRTYYVNSMYEYNTVGQRKRGQQLHGEENSAKK